MQKRYIEKIKKLLNLARKTTFAHEAAAAISQARKIMMKYNISSDDIECADINEASSRGTPSSAERPPEYVVHLAAVIAIAFGVRWYMDRVFYPRPKNKIIYYGPAERPEIAAYAFDVLARQLHKGRREYLSGLHRNIKPANKTKRADIWCSAWVAGAYELITEFAITEPEQTLMDIYRQKKFNTDELKIVEARKPGKVHGSDNAVNSGWIAGRQARLNQAVTGNNNEQTKLIGGQYV